MIRVVRGLDVVVVGEDDDTKGSVLLRYEATVETNREQKVKRKGCTLCTVAMCFAQ